MNARRACTRRELIGREERHIGQPSILRSASPSQMAVQRRCIDRLTHAFGGTFAFNRNKFCGSYLRLSATSREKLAP